jgi:hypothetical protein
MPPTAAPASARADADLDAAVRSVSEWAALELRLRTLPPPAVLRELLRPPRARALWTHLAARARAPAHAAAVIHAARLAPRGEDEDRDRREEMLRDEIQRAEEEAESLEEELNELRTQLQWRPDKLNVYREREGAAAVGAMHDAFAAVLRGETVRVNDAAECVAKLGAACAESDADVTMHKEVESVLRKMDIAARSKGSERDAAVYTVLTAIESLVATYSLPGVANATASLAASAVDQSMSIQSSLKNRQSVDRQPPDRNSLIAELRELQMETFLRTEEVVTEKLRAEALLKYTLSEPRFSPETDTTVAEAKLLAKLTGERAAIAAVDHALVTMRRRAVQDDEICHVQIEADRDLARTIAQNSTILASHDNMLSRLAAESKAMLANAVTSTLERVTEAMVSRLPQSCSAAVAVADARQHVAKHHMATIASLDPYRDAKIRIGESWRPRRNLLATSLDAFDSDVVVSNIGADDALFAHAELINEKHVKALLLDTLRRDIERNVAIIGAIDTRAGRIADTIDNDRVAQGAEYGPLLNESVRIVNDCLDRLIPGTEHELHVWLTQPARTTAPWHKVKGRTLTEWESLLRSELGVATSPRLMRSTGSHHS